MQTSRVTVVVAHRSTGPPRPMDSPGSDRGSPWTPRMTHLRKPPGTPDPAAVQINWRSFGSRRPHKPFAADQNRAEMDEIMCALALAPTRACTRVPPLIPCWSMCVDA